MQASDRKLFEEGREAGRIQERYNIREREIENERSSRQSEGSGIHYLKIHLFDDKNFYYGELNTKSMINGLLNDKIKISSDVVIDLKKIKNLSSDKDTKGLNDYQVLINIDNSIIDSLKLEESEKELKDDKEESDEEKKTKSIKILKKNINILIKALFNKNKNIKLNNSQMEIIRVRYFDNKTRNNKSLYSRNKTRKTLDRYQIKESYNKENIIDYYWDGGESGKGDFVRYVRDKSIYSNFIPEELDLVDLNVGGLNFNIIVKIKVHKGKTKLKKQFIKPFDKCAIKRIALNEQLAYHIGEFEKYLKPKNKTKNEDDEMVKGGKKTYKKKKKRKYRKHKKTYKKSQYR
jgi:hypothetical protein